MFIKKRYEGKMPFKITEVQCSQRWISEVGDSAIDISCKINGVPCQFPFGAARWGKLVGGLGIDCDEVLFPATRSVWPERERISTGGGGQNYYALFISDRVVTSQPKENQKDFRFTGQLYSTAPIVKAFKPKLMELYDKGLLTQKFLERVGAAGSSPANESALMVRGKKPTGLLYVVDRIAKAKNSARAQDLQGIFAHYMALSNVLLNTDGIVREQVPGKPYYVYSVSDALHSRYKDACRELGRGYYELDGKYVPGKGDSAPQTETPAATPEGSVIPFDQCFFAEMILDAKDYSGDRECSWIDPKNLNHVLSVYEDDDGTPLSRKMGDLKQKYDRLKEKCLADGKAKVSRVGEDYGTIDSESIPGIKDYLEMWPRHSRDGRVQQATSLWMCVAPSRDKVKFDSNEWHSRPVIDVE